MSILLKKVEFWNVQNGGGAGFLKGKQEVRFV